MLTEAVKTHACIYLLLWPLCCSSWADVFQPSEFALQALSKYSSYHSHPDLREVLFLGHSASHQQCSNMPLQLYVPGQVDKEPSPCSHLDNEKLSNGKDKEALEQVAWGTGGVSIESLRTG